MIIIISVEIVNTMFSFDKEVETVKRFAKGMVRHRVLVIILCLALVVPSVLGMAATKTKYDLLYYLPQDLETVKGQEILLEDFGKGAFSLLVTEGMTVREQADLENAIREIPHVDSVIGYASLTKGQFPLEDNSPTPQPDPAIMAEQNNTEENGNTE